MKLYWTVYVYDGTEILYRRVVKHWDITESKIEIVLKSLVAKYSLTDDEILNSFARSKSICHEQHLDIRIMSGDSYTLSCGSNPFAVATITDEKGYPIPLQKIDELASLLNENT